MSGKDGNRGYLVQTVIALLQALQSDDWHTITLEPQHESETVDILLERPSSSTKTQVKSSSLQFTLRKVEKLAKELEIEAVADDFKLVLVGACAESVAKKRKIGRVTIECKNLDLIGMTNEAAHLLAIFLDLENLVSESTKHRELLVNALITQLSIRASESQRYPRSEFLQQVQQWLSATEQPPKEALLALSPAPRSFRRHYGAGLIGRDEDLSWLHHTVGDKLIHAQPGMGKTFLLKHYAEKTNALFLIGTDVNAIADAIARKKPAAVLIEDGAEYRESIEFLLRYRRDQKLAFEIIVDCWPGDVDDLSNMLGLQDSNKRKLHALDDSQIIEIIKTSGIHGPNRLLHLLRHQASGCPGRVLMLIDACRQGKQADREQVWTGEKLASEVRALCSRKFGELAIAVLACFSLGGADGVAVSAVADILQRTEQEVRNTVRNLALGGLIVDFNDGRLIVVPELLRAILVRDSLINPFAAAPLSNAVQRIGLSPNLVRTLIASHAQGARIQDDELRRLVQEIDSESVWRDYAHSGSENADWIIQNRPTLISSLSDVLLQSSPDNTIPHLLELARRDRRLEHQTPDHPMRRMLDWVESGTRGRTAVERRKTTLNAFKSYLATGGNVDLAALLIPLIMSPRFSDTEQSPTDLNRFTVIRGGLSPDDLIQVSAFWKEIFICLRTHSLSEWKPLLSAINEWQSPNFGRAAVTEDQLKVMRSAVREILPQAVTLACDRPGVLTTLKDIAGRCILPVTIHIDETFALLFPDQQSQLNDPTIMEMNRKKAVMTAKEWANSSPTLQIRRMKWCISESKQMLIPPLNYCHAVLNSIAETAKDIIPWIDAVIAHKLPKNLVTHLLITALRRNEAGALERLRTLLINDHFREEAVFVALRCDVPDEIRQLAISECVHVLEVVDRLVMTHELTAATIEEFLMHKDYRVVSQALRGLWQAQEKNPIPATCRQLWLDAATRYFTDEWCLQQALQSDPEFRLAWLQKQCCNTDRTSHYISEKVFALATADLTEQIRCDLICIVSPKARYAEDLIKNLVSDSPQALCQLLKNSKLQHFHHSILARLPGDAWIAMVQVMAKHGSSCEDIVNASRRYFQEAYLDEPHKYHTEIQVWSNLTTNEIPLISLVAKRALRLAQDELRSWEMHEKRIRLG